MHLNLERNSLIWICHIVGIFALENAQSACYSLSPCKQLNVMIFKLSLDKCETSKY